MEVFIWPYYTITALSQDMLEEALTGTRSCSALFDHDSCYMKSSSPYASNKATLQASDVYAIL